MSKRKPHGFKKDRKDLDAEIRSLKVHSAQQVMNLLLSALGTNPENEALVERIKTKADKEHNDRDAIEYRRCFHSLNNVFNYEQILKIMPLLTYASKAFVQQDVLRVKKQRPLLCALVCVIICTSFAFYLLSLAEFSNPERTRFITQTQSLDAKVAVLERKLKQQTSEHLKQLISNESLKASLVQTQKELSLREEEANDYAIQRAEFESTSSHNASLLAMNKKLTLEAQKLSSKYEQELIEKNKLTEQTSSEQGKLLTQITEQKKANTSLKSSLRKEEETKALAQTQIADLEQRLESASLELSKSRTENSSLSAGLAELKEQNSKLSTSSEYSLRVLKSKLASLDELSKKQRSEITRLIQLRPSRQKYDLLIKAYNNLLTGLRIVSDKKEQNAEKVWKLLPVEIQTRIETIVKRDLVLREKLQAED